MEKSNLSMDKKIYFGGTDWSILDRQNGKILILSDVALGKLYYHDKHEFIVWADCSLRKLLNEKLYNFFSTEEKNRIVDTTVVNNCNPLFRTDGGIATIDKIFLLSIDEVIQYFGDSGQLKQKKEKSEILASNQFVDDQFNEKRKMHVKLYNKSDIHTWYIDEEKKVSFGDEWWLRSSGGHGTCTAYVDQRGRISLFGKSSIAEIHLTDERNDIKMGVRPALWLNV